MKKEGTALPAKKLFFEAMFEQYHRPEFISPDPLELLYLYHNPSDREIVGLLASALAYGRVAQILKSVERVLNEMRPSPRKFLEKTGEASLREIFRGFKHRFTTDCELVELLLGIQDALRKYGSLQACFLAGLSDGDETTLPALVSFVREIGSHSCGRNNSLISLPERKSACKRLHLFLRWMVRSDDVDPGGWDSVAPAKLLVPLDTHMFRICAMLGMTSRSQADMRASEEITAGFRKIDPLDPVRYDFALTRLGIRRVGELSSLIERYA